MGIYRRQLFVIGVGIVALGVQAQEVDTSDWRCEFCPFEQGHRSDYEFGATSVSEDSAYVGDATGYDEEGVYANVDGDGSYAGERSRLNWAVQDLGLDSRRVDLSAGRPGMFKFDASYRELPRRQFNTTTTVFAPSGGGVLALPSDWDPAGLTSGMTQLGPSLKPRNIESDRSTLGLGATYTPASRWQFSADYRRQERDGSKIQGGSSFTQSSLLPMPLDYTTNEFDVRARFGADTGFVSLAWYLSDFDNGNADLTWQTPFTSAPGAETPAIAQAPDSRFQQLAVAAGFVLPAYETVVSAKAAIGEIEQDSRFLAYTTNANRAGAPLPRSNLAGDVDTRNFSVAVTSRITEKARIKLSYRFDERENNTAQDSWSRIIVDTFVSNDAEMNIPHSFERSTLRASADYDLFESVKVSGGYERRDTKRDFQEVADQTEDSGWGQLRWRPFGTLEIKAKGGASERDFDRYDEGIAASLGQNPLMRKYHFAYRYRRFGELAIVYSPSTVPFSISLDGFYADDNYNLSRLGITDGEELRVAANLNWAVTENVAAYLMAGADQVESEQAGSELFSVPDWRATLDDDFTTTGFGLRVRNIADKVDLQIDYTRTDGETEIGIDSMSGGSSEFPKLASEFDYLRFKLSYQHSERLAGILRLRYQRFVADDWALEGVRPATIPVVLSLGAQPYSPEVLIVGLSFRYRFGAAKTAD